MKEGLYDQLLTRRLRELLDTKTVPGFKSLIEKLEENDCPDYLSRYVGRQLKLALQSLPAEDRKERQVQLANAILDFVRSREESLLEDDVLNLSDEILRAVYRGDEPPRRPTTPLSASTLLMNAVDEPRLGFELEREMSTSDRVFMLVSFIQWRGWQRLKNTFHDLAARNISIRVLTTTYIGATDFGAIQEMAKLPNIELRVSLDGRRRRLHAKAWLFERDNGFSSVYVGSANLSGPALEDGIEWTVKLSEVEAPHIVQRFHGAFDSLWWDPEFEQFRADDDQFCQRVRLSLEDARQRLTGHESPSPVFFDLRPHAYQQATLDQLESERKDRNHFRNLVVAPTGTGKTMIAAFDYVRQPFTGSRPRLLYLAHREELIRQARDRFRHVLRDESFGDLLGGGDEPTGIEHLFSTIQSFGRRELLKYHRPDYWAYVVLDEAHHVPAEGYRDIVATLNPQILLGLTATPERMDGESILPWFDNRIADEMRLWHAVEKQYLVPFDYFGIYDGTDLSQLSWKRGSYLVGELEQQYIGDSRRANLIIKQFCDRYGDWKSARTLGFCVSIAHAGFMAQTFCDAGIPALAITSQSHDGDRSNAVKRLRNREVNLIFTVDLFNEGVDIPEVDCILFLRPTESATVFLQQLGRGLRHNLDKNSCLVLDFIGNQRREFRFDRRFQALLGGTRKQVADEIETGVTRLPGNCYFQLDKESKTLILENLRAQLRTSRARMTAELRALAEYLRRVPTLAEYLTETQYVLEDIYKPAIGGWHVLLHDANLRTEIATESSISLTRRFQYLLQIDSPRRLQFYLDLCSDRDPKLDSLPLQEKRMVEMLTVRILSQQEWRDGAWDTAFKRLQETPPGMSEFQELCSALCDRVKFHADDNSLLADSPVFLHRQYTRQEVMVGLGLPNLVYAWTAQQGRFFIKEANTEIFFVTLDKSEKIFSPSTRYEDYAVSPTRFHWQSQSTTSESSSIGQRYVHQKENGTQFLLFVRPTTRDPFLFLGPLRYVSHSGSRPMSIYWDLDYPIPAWFFEICASFRGA